MQHTTSRYGLYFGNAHTALIPQMPAAAIPLHNLKELLSLQHIIIQKQEHGVAGLILTEKYATDILQPFSHAGDFIVTSIERIGIGIVTADCLPIIMYDSAHHVIAIGHAGWRGSVQQIAPRMLETLHTTFGSEPAAITIWFGPCAKPCCYEIQDDFLSHLQRFDCMDRVIHTDNHKRYFNLPTFNRLLLQQQGVPVSAIHMTYNQCTICTPDFISVRRMHHTPLRQLTLAWLSNN